MKHLAAYLLLKLTNPNPTKEDIATLLGTVGVVPDQERLNALSKLLEGKDINEVIALYFWTYPQLIEEGTKKLVGYSVASSTGPVVQKDGNATPIAKEEKPDEGEEQESDEVCCSSVKY